MCGKTRNRLSDQPVASCFPEKIASRTPEDKIPVQKPVYSVFQTCLLLHKPGPVCHLLPERLGAVVRNPDLRKPPASQESYQHLSIDLVGLYFRLGNGPGADGIRDHHAAGVLLQEARDRVCIARRFQCDLVIGAQCPREDMERFWRRRNPAELTDLSTFQYHNLGKFPVYVQADETQGNPPSR
jgi:hypothetical protein